MLQRLLVCGFTGFLTVATCGLVQAQAGAPDVIVGDLVDSLSYE